MRGPAKPDEEERRLVRNLTKIRKTLKITQRELADHLGISPQQYGKVERGENRLSLGRFVAALTYLKDAKPKNADVSMGFAEVEQALYTYPGDARGELFEAIRSIQTDLARIENAALRVTGNA